MSHANHDDRGPRVFGLSDAMILTAATAMAFGCLRNPWERRLGFIADGRIIDNLRPFTIIGAAFLTCWGLAVVVIQIRHGRLHNRGWSNRPGFVGCAAASAGVLAKSVVLLAWGESENYRLTAWYVPTVLGQLIEPAAMGVLGAWLTLWLVGLWRLERTWIDSLGILIGLAWIGLFAAAWCALCFG